MKKGMVKRKGKWISVDPEIIDWRKRRAELKAKEKDERKEAREAMLAFKKATQDGLE